MSVSALGRVAAAATGTDLRSMTQRRFRAVNLSFLLPVLTSVGALLVARQAEDAGEAAVLAAGVVAALVAFERWTAGDVARVAAPCLVVAAVVWPYGILAVDSDRQAAFFALAVVTGLVAPALPRRRGLVAVGLGVYVAAVGLLGVVLAEQPAVAGLVQDVLIPTGVTAVVVGAMFPNKGFYDLMTELEESRGREAELAVARERIRFAGDLHDIQGHTLHVVKLKVALASKLLTTDVTRAERELDEVCALVADTIAQTREVAYGRRTLNLSAELENARTLLEATGAQVDVDGQVAPDAPAADLMAQVLRETTTNILRHSRARTVTIRIADRSIDVLNDGLLGTQTSHLRGLQTLARRAADAGGEVTAGVEASSFRTRAVFDGTTTTPACSGHGLAAPGATARSDQRESDR